MLKFVFVCFSADDSLYSSSSSEEPGTSKVAVNGSGGRNASAACNICKERVPLSSSSIAAHLLEAHGIGSRTAATAATAANNNKRDGTHVTAKVFSDKRADMCRVKCRFCGRDVSAGSITKHARLYHGVQNSLDYGEIEYINPTYHSCKLCGLEMIFTARSIQKHVTRRHQISPEAYRKEYLTHSSQLAVPAVKNSGKEKNSAASSLCAQLVTYTDDLRDVCWVRCRLCGEGASLDRIREHCRKEHQDTSPLVTASHAFTRRTFHVCKVCGVEFQLSIGALCRHLLEAHKLSLSSYIIFYLGITKYIKHECVPGHIK